MNPKMTEFLAQDRIAEFRHEAAGRHLLERAATTRPHTPAIPATRHETPFGHFWHRVRRAITA